MLEVIKYWEKNYCNTQIMEPVDFPNKHLQMNLTKSWIDGMFVVIVVGILKIDQDHRYKFR